MNPSQRYEIGQFSRSYYELVVESATRPLRNTIQSVKSFNFPNIVTDPKRIKSDIHFARLNVRKSIRFAVLRPIKSGVFAIFSRVQVAVSGEFRVSGQQVVRIASDGRRKR